MQWRFRDIFSHQLAADHGALAVEGLSITESAGGVPPPIAGAPTSIALFAGWAPSGPTDRAVHLQSVLDYQDNFGSIDPTSLLGHAVYHFYDGGNAGADAYALRIAGASSAPVGPKDEVFLSSLRAAFAENGPVDQIEELNLICVPGLTEPGMIAMLQACARRRGAFLVDCDEGATVTTIAASLQGKTGADAPNSALYFPWVVAPDLSPDGTTRAYPPCGFVAGLYARIDRQRGVWKAPAGDGAVLTGALGLSVSINDAESSALNPLGINCLRSFPNTGPGRLGRAHARLQSRRLGREVCFGATPHDLPGAEPDCRFAMGRVPAEQRGAMGEASPIGRHLHEWPLQGGRLPGDRLCASLHRHMRRDDHDPGRHHRGVVNIVIGFAPLKPAEFVVITIAQPAGSG